MVNKRPDIKGYIYLGVGLWVVLDVAMGFVTIEDVLWNLEFATADKSKLRTVVSLRQLNAGCSMDKIKRSFGGRNEEIS